jgi:hypothetical protein
MRDSARAANAESRSRRRCQNALDREQAAAVGMTGYGGNFHRLAAERVRHVYGLSFRKGDAVTVMSDVIDDKVFSHGALR